jgi:small-conductance mechanosensitive channel
MMIRRFLALCLVVLTALTAPVWAQDTSLGPDYDQWTQLADRAEGVIDAERASDPAFETLRAQIAEYREQFRAATGANAARIETLRAQIVALGPVPEDGSPEPDEISSQRTDLGARLAEAEAPGRRAEAELRRAQGLIGEIDRLLASRQAGALLTLQPSPINPANWPGAITAVFSYLNSLANENLRLWSSPIYQEEFSENLPLVLIYLLVGMVLILRGWRWVGRMMRRPVEQEESSPAARLSVFFLSIAQHGLPALGVIALAQAVEESSFVGLRGSVILAAIPQIAITVAAAIWIGRQVFPARETAARPLNLPEVKLARGRRAAGWLGLLMGVSQLVDAIAESEGFQPAERLVIFFPLVILTGLFLARLGRFLVLHAKAQSDLEDPASLRTRVFGLIGRAVLLLGFAGPVLAGVGYFTAGSSFLFPAVLSLSLLALLGVLQRLVANVYGAFTGRQDGLDEALTPTLIGFLLTIASVPIFALIWGMRQAQLADLWEQLILGFDLGGVHISPRSFLSFAIVFVVGYTATRLIQSTLRNSVLPKTKLDAGGRNAVVTGTGYVGIFLAALVAITVAGIDLSSIAIVAGALSVGIGFGLQAIVSNFVSGIILLVERPIKEGDWIQIGTTAGYVREISVRSTRIETFDRSDVIVPNADLISGVVTNMTHHNSTGRVIVPVGVAYGTDTKRVEAILQEVAEAHPMVLLTPPPNVIFQGFGADSLNFEIRAILRDVNWMLSVKSDMNHEIAKRFAEAGIEIPFAQRDIWIRNPDALKNTTVLTGAENEDDGDDRDTSPQEEQ